MAGAEAPRAVLSDATSIPVIGLGTFKGNAALPSVDDSSAGEVERAVRDAIDAGYRHIDAALFYGTEDQVGRAVAAKIGQGAVRREDMYICTKLWNNDHRPDLVEAACRRSLANLGLDYVDLYLMHWPTAYKEGAELVPRGADGRVLYSDVDILDTYRAMEALVDKGLTRSIGVSNFNSAQLERLLSNCSIKPVVNQVQNNAIPIPKSVTKSRIEENLNIFDFELPPEDMATIDGLDKNGRACVMKDAADHPEYPFAIDF